MCRNWLLSQYPMQSLGCRLVGSDVSFKAYVLFWAVAFRIACFTLASRKSWMFCAVRFDSPMKFRGLSDGFILWLMFLIIQQFSFFDNLFNWYHNRMDTLDYLLMRFAGTGKRFKLAKLPSLHFFFRSLPSYPSLAVSDGNRSRKTGEKNNPFFANTPQR